MSKEEKMVVGTLRIRLVIRSSRSLKDKRHTVKSIKDRIAAKFNASVAEVGLLDVHQQALIGVAVVGNDGAFVQSVLTQISNLVTMQARDAEVASCEMEIW